MRSAVPTDVEGCGRRDGVALGAVGFGVRCCYGASSLGPLVVWGAEHVAGAHRAVRADHGRDERSAGRAQPAARAIPRAGQCAAPRLLACLHSLRHRLTASLASCPVMATAGRRSGRESRSSAGWRGQKCALRQLNMHPIHTLGVPDVCAQPVTIAPGLPLAYLSQRPACGWLRCRTCSVAETHLFRSAAWRPPACCAVAFLPCTKATRYSRKR